MPIKVVDLRLNRLQKATPPVPNHASFRASSVGSNSPDQAAASSMRPFPAPSSFLRRLGASVGWHVHPQGLRRHFPE
jgi:hypothetical protein